MEVDSNTLELLEHRLSAKVEVQVRERLFKFYRALWAVAFAVLGFFGYNVISGLSETAKSYAETAVQSSVENANEAAALALKQASAVSAHLTAMDEFQKRRETALLENESRVISDQAKVERLSAETDEKLQTILNELSEAEAQLAAMSQRATEVAGVGNVTDLATSLASLTEQVQLIDEAMRELEQGSPEGTPAVFAKSDHAQITSILETVQSQAEAPASLAGTVYFQFAGVKRDVAEAISAALTESGYTMPAEERTSVAADLHEVRFFFEADRQRAGELAEDVNGVLSELGYRPDVTARDLTGYTASKPREGTMELWLEPVRLPA